MHTYKGYEVTEEIIHDYEYPETALVLSAPCGCQACQDQVQEGHFACDTSPEDLRDDRNVYPRLEGSHWFWEYVGLLETLITHEHLGAVRELLAEGEAFGPTLSAPRHFNSLIQATERMRIFNDHRHRCASTTCRGCRHNYYNIYPKPYGKRDDRHFEGKYQCKYIPAIKRNRCLQYSSYGQSIYLRVRGWFFYLVWRIEKLVKRQDLRF